MLFLLFSRFVKRFKIIGIILLILIHLLYISKIILNFLALFTCDIEDPIKTMMYISIGWNIIILIICIIYDINIIRDFNMICNISNDSEESSKNNKENDIVEILSAIAIFLMIIASLDIPLEIVNFIDIINNTNISPILMSSYIITIIVAFPGTLIVSIFISVMGLMSTFMLLTCGCCGMFCN